MYCIVVKRGIEKKVNYLEKRCRKPVGGVTVRDHMRNEDIKLDAVFEREGVSISPNIVDTLKKMRRGRPVSERLKHQISRIGIPRLMSEDRCHP